MIDIEHGDAGVQMCAGGGACDGRVDIGSSGKAPSASRSPGRLRSATRREHGDPADPGVRDADDAVQGAEPERDARRTINGKAPSA